MEKSKQKKGIMTFEYAFRGLAGALRTEPNVRIHSVIAVLVISLGLIFGITRTEWLILILCISQVIVAETFNTALERLVDMVSPQVSEKAGMVKDMAAGAVLFSAMASVVAGIIIFVPYLAETFKRL